ncbi:MAG: NlpC/P60 family protein [Bacteroidales bacterium]
MFAINLNPLIPLRAAADEGAEQLTQILFGELFYIIEKMDRWVCIRNVADNYEGWVDKKMITPIDQLEFTRLLQAPLSFITEPLAKAQSAGENMYLPMGAFIRDYDRTSETFKVADSVYSVPRAVVEQTPTEKSVTGLMHIAKRLLNAPYQWGGKTILGIDCSGLTQIAYRMEGINIPRDARQQIQHGLAIHSLGDAKTGDLIFFATADDKVKHVGIYVEPFKILHASGFVHFDDLDEEGNILSKITSYSHYHLAGIRRYISKI